MFSDDAGTYLCKDTSHSDILMKDRMSSTDISTFLFASRESFHFVYHLDGKLRISLHVIWLLGHYIELARISYGPLCAFYNRNEEICHYTEHQCYFINVYLFSAVLKHLPYMAPLYLF